MHSLPLASSLPAGFHSVMPYLIFDGTAAKAIAFYCDAFGATELPGRLTDPTGRILDAGIMIGDSVIRVGDEAPWRIAESELGGTAQIFHRPRPAFFVRLVVASTPPTLVHFYRQFGNFSEASQVAQLNLRFVS
jgi:hypothetical protein